MSDKIIWVNPDPGTETGTGSTEIWKPDPDLGPGKNPDPDPTPWKGLYGTPWIFMFFMWVDFPFTDLIVRYNGKLSERLSHKGALARGVTSL